eukprot:TRINITY_DN6488_c0_g2_i1.p1 TRINITY_DN6488_c0_g2~~TRINITY_DN6488_c0_g2_i1.p1  ORF type:complete len:252 (+),score=53.78 TRINITY_DN6488_c0_g2_i1:22-756(+)
MSKPKGGLHEFVPERIIFFIDICDEMQEDEMSRSAAAVLSMSRRPSRMDHIKTCLRGFMLTKQRMSQHHEFALALLTDSTHWLCDFTSDVDQICKMMGGLKPGDAYPSFDMDSLFKTLRDKSNLFPRDGAYSRPLDDFVYRGIVFYGRSLVIPTYTSTTLHSKTMKHPRLFVDVIYLHSKPSSHNKTQEVYDALSDLDMEQERSYLFENSTSLRRFKLSVATLLANPVQRPSQQDFKAALNEGD